jgi:hypothetical protein
MIFARSVGRGKVGPTFIRLQTLARLHLPNETHVRHSPACLNNQPSLRIMDKMRMLSSRSETHVRHSPACLNNQPSLLIMDKMRRRSGKVKHTSDTPQHASEFDNMHASESHFSH